jgi:hypothetical protein
MRAPVISCCLMLASTVAFAEKFGSFGYIHIEGKQTHPRSYAITMHADDLDQDGKIILTCYPDNAGGLGVVIVAPHYSVTFGQNPVVTIWSDRSSPVDVQFAATPGNILALAGAGSSADWGPDHPVGGSRTVAAVLTAFLSAERVLAYSFAGRTATLSMVHLKAARLRFQQLCKI